MLKIQRSTDGATVRFALSGRVDGQGLAELQRLIAAEAPGRVDVLDLEEVRLVGREGIAFLARCETKGIRLESCAAWVREWITREGNALRKPGKRRKSGTIGTPRGKPRR